MKRDWELIRYLLLQFEGNEGDELNKYDDTLIMEHAFLLMEAGYLKNIHFQKNQVGTIIGMKLYGNCHITMAGYDLLDSIRRRDIWDKVLAVIKERGGSLAISIVSKLAQKYIETQLGL